MHASFLLRLIVWVLVTVLSAWLVGSAVLLGILSFDYLTQIEVGSNDANNLREAAFWASVGVFWMLPWLALFLSAIALIAWLPVLAFRQRPRAIQRASFIILFTLISAAWIGVPLAMSNSLLHMDESRPDFMEIVMGSSLGAISGFVFALATDWMSSRLELAVPEKWRV